MSLVGKLLHLFAGLAVGALGLMIGVVGLLAVLDPVGSKASDGSDSFGPTIGIVPIGVVSLVVSIAIIAFGAYLIWRINRKQ